MTVDLTPLEQAAARCGLAGVQARLVPHDRRRGRWFRWNGRVLLVSERLLERCTPVDAVALLVNDIAARRRLRRTSLTTLLLLVLVGVLALLVSLAEADVPAVWLALPIGGVALHGLLSRMLAIDRADDDTVALLGEATALVRGLNAMSHERMDIFWSRLPSRPDLHRRAERLARLHRLCEAQPPA